MAKMQSLKMQWIFCKYILLSKQNKTVFSGKMATNGRKRYIQTAENDSSEQIYVLLDDS